MFSKTAEEWRRATLRLGFGATALWVGLTIVSIEPSVRLFPVFLIVLSAWMLAGFAATPFALSKLDDLPKALFSSCSGAPQLRRRTWLWVKIAGILWALTVIWVVASSWTLVRFENDTISVISKAEFRQVVLAALLPLSVSAIALLGGAIFGAASFLSLTKRN